MGMLHHNGAELTPRPKTPRSSSSTPAASSTRPNRSRSTPSSRWSSTRSRTAVKPNASSLPAASSSATATRSRRTSPKLTPSWAQASSRQSSPQQALLPAVTRRATRPSTSFRRARPKRRSTPTPSAWLRPTAKSRTSNRPVPAPGLTLTAHPAPVSQHSRPLADPEHDREIAPQLRIVQSLAETGTTHGDEPLNHTGDHIAHLPIGLPVGIDAGNTSHAPKATSASSRAASPASRGTVPPPHSPSTSTTTPPRASSPHRARRPTSRSPKAATTPAASASFRSFAASSARAACRRSSPKPKTSSSKASARSPSSARTPPATAKTSASPTASPRCLTRSPCSLDLRWLRFLYTYPNKVTTRLLETMAKHDTIAKYLDVPAAARQRQRP